MMRELPTSGLPAAILSFDEEAFSLLSPVETMPSCGNRDAFPNLSIALLPCEDARYVLRMLDAFAIHLSLFGGEIIILDGTPNGEFTVDPTLVTTRLPYAHARGVSLISGRSLADAKNHAIVTATRDWIWFLDPRTILSWNPLVLVEEDLSRSGAHFLNLPRVDAHGRVSSRDRMQVTCRDGGVELSIVGGLREASTRLGREDYAYVSAVDSASLVARVESLREVGGFSSSAVRGTEDVDLAKKLHAGGRKIIVSRAVAIYEGDSGPEQGFTTLSLFDPAKAIMGNVLPYDLEALPPTEVPASDNASPLASQGRPRIALIIDVDHWAFGNIARQLCRYLSNRYEFIVVPIGVVSSVARVLMIAKDCDLIHFFWREDPVQIGNAHMRDYVESLGFRWSEFYKKYIADKAITTSVYDHLLLESEQLDQRRFLYTETLAGYTVASKRLDLIYRQIAGYPAPNIIAEDGVDLTLFKPIRLERFASAGERKLVIGWAGNSKWEADREDFKGLHSILQPAIDELQRDGYPVSTYYADRQVRFIPHREMPEYYAKIDVYVCPSKIEGTPNPVLESMACGVPVISTDVGVVPQAFGELQRQFILPERSKDALKTMILRLLDRPQLLLELSRENLESIRFWDWSVKAENFDRFFQIALSSKESRIT